LLRLCKVCANFSHAYTEGALGFQGLSLETANPLGATGSPESFSSWVIGDGVTDLPLGRSALPGDFSRRYGKAKKSGLKVS